MRKLTYVVAGIALLIAAGLAGRSLAKTSVTGQLIDMACYGQNKENTGLAHKGRGLVCARACALEGFPVGLLTSDGKVYQVTGDLAANSNANLLPHITHTVTISGDVTEKDGHTLIAASDLSMAK
jgi:hypothetical protein